jgi:hypothetical protein
LVDAFRSLGDEPESPRLLADASERCMVMYRSINGVLRNKRGFEGRRAAERFLNATMEAVDGGRVVATREGSPSTSTAGSVSTARESKRAPTATTETTSSGG